MKVLICLAFVGCAFASQAIYTEVAQPVAVAHAAIVPATKAAYEYSADVHTPTYNTHQSVKSNIADVAVAAAPVVQYAAAAPVVQYAAAAPVVQYASAAPAVHYAAAAPAVHYAAAAPVIAHAPVATTTVVQSDIIAPAKYIAAEPTVVVSAPAAPIVGHFAAAPAVHAIVPASHSSSSIVAGDKVQYHSQDSLGQAAYGHSEALQSHNAVQDITGSKAGSFSYVAPDGRLLTTDYVADHDGYRVATNALPHARRRRSILAAYSAPILPYAYAYPSSYYQPAVYSAPIIAGPSSASSTSSFVNHGDGLSSTHQYQLH